MTILRFPADRIVGTLHWAGSLIGRGPVLATGSVEVPDGTRVELRLQMLSGSEPIGGGWSLIPVQDARVDLGFVTELPSDAVQALTVQGADEASSAAIPHLAPGLERLYLPFSRFSDAVLPAVARLTELTYLQTFGNQFTNPGVQVLAALTKLDHLYLEEETLSLAAFDFVTKLPRLSRLGLQDVPLSDKDLQQLRDRLPGLDVG